MTLKISIVLVTIAILCLNMPTQGQKEINNNTLLKKGNDSMNSGSYYDAINYFNEYIKMYPDSSIAWSRKGWCHYYIDQVNEANKSFNLALSIDVNNIDAILGRCYVLSKNGDSDKSLEQLIKIINMQPSPQNSIMRKAMNEIGFIYETRSETERNDEYINTALLYYINVTKIDPYYDVGYFNTANAYRKLGEISDFQSMSFQNSGDEANAKKAKDSAKKFYENAIHYYNKAIFFKNRDKYHYNLGITFYALGKFEESLEAFDNATTINSYYSKAWHNKGIALIKLGKYGESILVMNNALNSKNDSEIANTYFVEGIVASEKLGRNDESIELFNKSIDKNPNFKEAYDSKGRILIITGRYKEAIQLFSNEAKKDASYEPFWRHMGSAQSLLGRDLEALVSYDTALKLLQSKSELGSSSKDYLKENYYGKGMTLYKLGCCDESIMIFNKIRDMDTRNSTIFSIFLITYIAIFLILYNNYRMHDLSIFRSIALLNAESIIAFAWLLTSFLNIEIVYKYIIIGLFIIIASLGAYSMLYFAGKGSDDKIIFSIREFEKYQKGNIIKAVAYAGIIVYAALAIIVHFHEYMHISSFALILLFKISIFLIPLISLICTMPILLSVILNRNNDKSTLDKIFVIYSSYLGIIALYIYWIIWSFGLTGDGYDKIKLGNISIEPYLVIIILSVVIIISMIPYIYSIKTIPPKREALLKVKDERLNELLLILDSPSPSDYINKLKIFLKNKGKLNTIKSNRIEIPKKYVWQLDPDLGDIAIIDAVKDLITKLESETEGNAGFNMATRMFIEDLRGQKEVLAELIMDEGKASAHLWTGLVSMISLVMGPALSQFVLKTSPFITQIDFSKVISSMLLGNA